jgi:predicted lipid-binding transport protein (Tim44 family)
VRAPNGPIGFTQSGGHTIHPPASPGNAATGSGGLVRELASATEREMRSRAASCPGWSPEAVRAWLEDVFVRIQSAWEEQDYAPVRQELGEDMCRRHTALLNEMRERGERGRAETVQVDGVEFVELTGPDGVVALVTFAGRSGDTCGEANRHGGDQLADRRPEAWFLRRVNGRWTVQGYVPADEYRMPTVAS